MDRYWGKYRGVVLNNLDPMMLGRLCVSLERLGGADAVNWALPCVPYAPADAAFVLRPIGTAVWVEFEGGDLNYPIWTGRYWREGEGPILADPAVP